MDVMFEDFWREYPRRVGRWKAEKIWRSLSEQERVKVMQGLKLWKQTVQWHQADGLFIPYASTFLHQRRYLDEPWAGAFETPQHFERPNRDQEPLSPKLQAVRDRIFARERGLLK